MRYPDRPVFRIILRGAGAALLAVAYMLANRLLVIGPEHVGQEPPIAYMMALIGFACASAGSALFFYGHHLLDRVRVSELWAPVSSMPDVGPER